MFGARLRTGRKKRKGEKTFNIHFTLFDSENTVINFLGYLNSSHDNIKFHSLISLSNVPKTFFRNSPFIHLIFLSPLDQCCFFSFAFILMLHLGLNDYLNIIHELSFSYWSYSTFAFSFLNSYVNSQTDLLNYRFAKGACK